MNIRFSNINSTSVNTATALESVLDFKLELLQLVLGLSLVWDLNLGLIPHWVLDQCYCWLLERVLSLELKGRRVLVLVQRSFSVRGFRWGRALIGRRTRWAAEKTFDLELWRSPQTPSDAQAEHALEHVPNTTHGSENIPSSVAMATAWKEAVQIKYFAPRLHVSWNQSGNAVFSQSLRSNPHVRKSE